jgi:hypothetical protein
VGIQDNRSHLCVFINPARLPNLAKNSASRLRFPLCRQRRRAGAPLRRRDHKNLLQKVHPFRGGADASLHDCYSVPPKLHTVDAPDAKPVSHMVIFLAPEHATEHHLQMLAEIAQMFGDRRFRERMRSCDSPDAVCRRFYP